MHGDVMDQLHDNNRLSYTGAAEEAGLTAFGIGFEQVDNFDTGFKDLGFGRKIFESRRIAMDGPGKFRIDLSAAVDRLTDNIDQASERVRTYGYRDRSTGI